MSRLPAAMNRSYIVTAASGWFSGTRCPAPATVANAYRSKYSTYPACQLLTFQLAQAPVALPRAFASSCRQVCVRKEGLVSMSCERVWRQNDSKRRQNGSEWLKMHQQNRGHYLVAGIDENLEPGELGEDLPPADDEGKGGARVVEARVATRRVARLWADDVRGCLHGVGGEVSEVAEDGAEERLAWAEAAVLAVLDAAGERAVTRAVILVCDSDNTHDECWPQRSHALQAGSGSGVVPHECSPCR